MSAFEEIQRACAEWRDVEHKYLFESADFARRFMVGFREYIGAPEHYLEMDRQTTKEYVEPRKIIRGAAGEDKAVLPEHGTDVLTRQDDGFYSFGLRLVVDSAVNEFPKQSLVYVIAFRIVDGMCEMKLAGNAFSFGVRDKEGRAVVYDHMVAVLKRELERKPWDGVRKQTIGFLPLSGG